MVRARCDTSAGSVWLAKVHANALDTHPFSLDSEKQAILGAEQADFNFERQI